MARAGAALTAAVLATVARTASSTSRAAASRAAASRRAALALLLWPVRLRLRPRGCGGSAEGSAVAVFGRGGQLRRRLLRSTAVSRCGVGSVVSTTCTQHARTESAHGRDVQLARGLGGWRTWIGGWIYLTAC